MRSAGRYVGQGHGAGTGRGIPFSVARSRASVEPGEGTASIEQAFKASGVTCAGGFKVGESTCNLGYTRFTVTITRGSRWKDVTDQRKSECGQEIINPDYLIATDGKTFLLASDSNENTQALAESLARAGLAIDVERYCP